MIAIVKIFEGGMTTIQEKDGAKVKVGNGAKVVVSQEYCEAHEYLVPFSEDEGDTAQDEALRKAEIEKAKAEAVAEYKAEQAEIQAERDQANKIEEKQAKSAEDDSLKDKEADEAKKTTPKGRPAKVSK